MACSDFFLRRRGTPTEYAMRSVPLFCNTWGASTLSLLSTRRASSKGANIRQASASSTTAQQGMCATARLVFSSRWSLKQAILSLIGSCISLLTGSTTRCDVSALGSLRRSRSAPSPSWPSSCCNASSRLTSRLSGLWPIVFMAATLICAPGWKPKTALRHGDCL